MKLTKEFQSKMLEMGMLHLKNAPEKMQDDEVFVLKAIAKHGAGEFEFASKRIKSEARIILTLVKTNPDILKFISRPIFQRYIDENNNTIEEKVNYFSVLCVDINDQCIQYLPKYLAIEFYKFISQTENASFIFYGETQKAFPSLYSDLKKNFKKLRPDIFKVK